MTKRKDVSRIGDLKVKLTPAEQERARQRAERFGVIPDDVKAKRRAAKFGTYHPQLHDETIKRRRERFNSPKEKQIESVEVTQEEREKRVRRAERFGTTNTELEQEKKKRRAERFNTNKTATLDELNRHLTQDTPAKRTAHVSDPTPQQPSS